MLSRKSDGVSKARSRSIFFLLSNGSTHNADTQLKALLQHPTNAIFVHRIMKLLASLSQSSEFAHLFGLQGVILYSMSDLALGFGVAAKATAECRHADPMQVVAFHQVNRSSLF